MRLEVTFDGDLSPDAILKRFGLEEHGPVQEAIDRAVIEYSLPYWAWDTGAAANSAYEHTDIGSGMVVWSTPYIEEIYDGVRSNGQTINYHTEHNPLAGAFPIERMKADHMDDIVEEARRVVRDQ